MVFAADLSERTRSKIERIACENGVKAVGAQFSMSELGRALGLYKSAAIAAICDKGLAELFIKKINEE